MFSFKTMKYSRLVALISIVVISAVGLSACGSGLPGLPITGANNPVEPRVVPTDERPFIDVNDQDVSSGKVIFNEILSRGPGWVVVQANQNNQPGPIIGYAHLSDGLNDGVIVKIDKSKATPILYATLLTDAGKIGVFEYPGPDTPVQMFGTNITPSFLATNLLK